MTALARLPARPRLPALVAGAAIVAHVAPVATDVPAVRRLFPTLQGDGRPGHVALTFDDGPDPAGTPPILDALDRLGMRATFFLLADMVTRDPGLARELGDRGHEVAVHGPDHRNLLLVGPRRTVSGLLRARDDIAAATDRTPAFYRPPYGVLSAAALLAARRAGLRPVLWGAWGRDWEQGASADSVLRTVRRGLRDGCTLLLHDSDCTSAPGSWRATLAALPGIAQACRAAGWTVGPLAEHGLPA